MNLNDMESVCQELYEVNSEVFRVHPALQQVVFNIIFQISSTHGGNTLDSKDIEYRYPPVKSLPLSPQSPPCDIMLVALHSRQNYSGICFTLLKKLLADNPDITIGFFVPFERLDIPWQELDLNRVHFYRYQYAGMQQSPGMHFRAEFLYYYLLESYEGFAEFHNILKNNRTRIEKDISAVLMGNEYFMETLRKVGCRDIITTDEHWMPTATLVSAARQLSLRLYHLPHSTLVWVLFPFTCDYFFLRQKCQEEFARACPPDKALEIGDLELLDTYNIVSSCRNKVQVAGQNILYVAASLLNDHGEGYPRNIFRQLLEILQACPECRLRIRLHPVDSSEKPYQQCRRLVDEFFREFFTRITLSRKVPIVEDYVWADYTLADLSSAIKIIWACGKPAYQPADSSSLIRFLPDAYCLNTGSIIEQIKSETPLSAGVGEVAELFPNIDCCDSAAAEVIFSNHQRRDYRVTLVIPAAEFSGGLLPVIRYYTQGGMFAKRQMEIIVIAAGITEAGLEQVGGHEDISYIEPVAGESGVRSLNRAFSRVVGKMVCLVRPGAVFTPEGLEAAVHALECRDDCTLAYADAALVAGDCLEAVPGQAGQFIKRPEFYPDYLFRQDYPGPLAVWRKSMFTRSGGLDEEMAESAFYDFCLRFTRSDSFLHVGGIAGCIDSSVAGAEEPRNHALARRRNWNEKWGTLPQAKELNAIMNNNSNTASGSGGEGPVAGEGNVGGEGQAGEILVSAITSTYASEKYIRQCLEDLAGQTLYKKGMLEIIVINSNSPEDEDRHIREFVEGHKNVIYIRTSGRETLYRAWNRGIRLAGGKYITNANTDDRHLPDALEVMAEALERRPDCSLAYADIAVTDDEAVTVGQSPVACLYCWPEYDRQLYFINSFAGPQPMWRRAVHDKYGYFDPEMKSAGDYDFFLRLAAGGETFLHIGRVLGLMLRSNQSVGLSDQQLTARETQAARQRSWKSEWGAMPQSRGIPVAIQLPAGADPYAWRRPQQQPPVQPSPPVAAPVSAVQNPPPAAGAGAGGAGQTLASSLKEFARKYREEPRDEQTVGHLRRMRQLVAQNLLNVPDEELPKVLDGGELGQCIQAILNCGLADEELLADEESNCAELKRRAGDVSMLTVQREKFLLCLMLYRHAWQEGLDFASLPFKGRLRMVFLQYMFKNPDIFIHPGDAEKFARHITAATAALRRMVEIDDKSPESLQALNFFLNNENFINMYFNTLNLRQVYEDRAWLISKGMRKAGYPLDYSFSPRRGINGKLRVGFLNSHFSPQTETYTSIPHFEYLDKEKFEVYLYTFSDSKTVLSEYCHSITDNFRILPPRDIPVAAATVRNDDLDLLVIGTNVSAVTNPATLMAGFRLARVQLVNNSTPVSTGFEYSDGYLSGTFVETGDYEKFFSEKVFMIKGTSHCFAYEVDNAEPVCSFTRAKFNVPEDAVLFSSGANFYKVIPEMKQTWVKILQAVPGSYLLLHPFNPNWSNAYPRYRFLASFTEELRRGGIDPSRLAVSMSPLPSRSDILELWKISDIYLDSFPFAGVNSTVDPLDVGVPVVVREADMFRSRMAGSLLRELQIPELITHSEDEYIDCAARLGNDKAFRTEMSAKITAAMADNPCFYDRRRFCGAVEDVLLEAWEELGK